MVFKNHHFASYHFTENGVKKYGKVTSNAAEQLNSVHIDNRGLPILLLLESINNWSVKMFFERKISVRNVTDDDQSLTNFASEREVCLGLSESSLVSHRTFVLGLGQVF